MKFKIDSLWKYIAGGGTVLGYQAFLERMVNKKKAIETQNVINDINNKIDLLSQNISNSNSEIEKRVLLENKRILKHYMDRMLDIHNKHYELHKGLKGNTEASQKAFESYSQEFTNAFNQARKIADNIDRSINNGGSFLHDNFITDLINQYKDYLSTLSMTEICLVINISSCLFIFGCLLSIVFAVYGNFIIEKFNLSEKFPKLAVLINLRIKLQHTYVITNMLLIITGLTSMIIVNYITLINI